MTKNIDRDSRVFQREGVGNVSINSAGEIVLHSGNLRNMDLYLTPAEAREIAYDLLDKADYVEGVGRAYASVYQSWLKGDMDAADYAEEKEDSHA